MVSDVKKIEDTQAKSTDDPKAKMLAALAKKQKSHSAGKPVGPTSGSKVGVGQTAGVAPKMHRRKAGSA